MNQSAIAVLRAVADTLIPGADTGGHRLSDHMLETLTALPRASDRDELERLLDVFDSRVANTLLTGRPVLFTALSRAEREEYLRDWAFSRLPLRRKGFQALKRIAAVIHYTARDAAGKNPAWERLRYPGPLAPPPPAVKPIHPLTLSSDQVLDCDAVVVGSGAGGGVVAAELAAAGKSVIVLEKGGYYNESEFTQYEGEMLSRLYDSGGLATSEDLGFVVLQGSCLGGGTVVNYTTSFHTPDAVRQQWATAHGLPHFTGAEFTRSLDAVAARIHVTVDEGRPGSRDQLLAKGLDRLGWHRGPLPRNVRGCSQSDDCGYCGYGCRRAAKQSTLVTYLQDAHARGARVVVHCEASLVIRERGRAVGIAAVVRDPLAPRAITLTVRAKAVIVAAGSIHSPALLFRSGIDLPALGRHLALHPSTAVFGEMPEEVRPWTGALQTTYSDQFADLAAGYGYKLETAPLHPSLFALAAPWESGAQFETAMARLSRTTLIGILLRDRDGGRVRVDRRGQPIVSYRLSPFDAGHLRHGVAAAAEVLEAAGATRIWSPHARAMSYAPNASATARRTWLASCDAAGYGANQILLATFHQMATCRMGSSPADSVVAEDHQVWGVPGLYVTDASAFPSSSGVNPMLTIMGMAHRAAGIIAAKI